MSKLNIVIGADITALKKGFDDAVSIVANGSKGMNEQVGKAAKDIQSRLEALASKRPTQRVVRELQTLAMEARQLGPEFKTMADQFIRAAGEMKDSIGDAAAEVGYFASDTRRLDALIGGAQALTGVFGLVEGSMAAAGIESEDLRKTMAKLQGIMTVLNSLQALQNALQAESALRVGITTAATKVQTYVMGQATVAARVFAGTMATLGIGAVVIALGSLMWALGGTQEELKKTADDSEKAFNRMKENAQGLAELSQTYDDAAIKRKLDAAKRMGASDEKLRDIEIAALNEVIKKRQDSLKNYEKGSLDYIAIDNYIAKLQVKKEDLVTNKISDAHKKRAADADKAAQEEKQRIKESQQLYEQGVQKQIDLSNHLKNIALQDAEVKYKNEDQLALAKLEINDKYLRKIIALNQQINKEDYSTKEQLHQNEIDLANKRKELGVQTVADLNTSLGKMKPVQIKFEAKMNMDSFAGQMKKVQEDISKNFEQLMEQLVIGFAETLGKVIAGEDGAFKDFGKQALAAIADFMKLVGSALITTAIASEAFQKMLFTNPIAAAAAGIALVAGSAIVKSQLEKGPEFKAFADGGIVYGPTLGLMGEYPGARSNPEVIAPLNKLKDMITPVNEGGYIASTRISGRDLALVIEKNQTAYNRG